MYVKVSLPILRLPVLIVLYCCYVQYSSGRRYEDIGKEFMANQTRSNSRWDAKLADVFVGKDMEEIKKNFFGLKPDYDKNGTKRRSAQSGKPKGRLTRLGGGGAKGRNGTKHRAAGTIPDEFDWRDYTYCYSLNQIRNQKCGDCWAVASAAVMSDRYCLYTNIDRYFSSRQVSSCVYAAGGCDGGYPRDAMNFYVSKGVATGGDPYVSQQLIGCVPYKEKMTNSLTCPQWCDDFSTMTLAKAGKYKELLYPSEQEIQNEIYNYGPVVAAMEVFEDFMYYSSRVYYHLWGTSQGGHAVRLIGWGEENGIPYWLGTNSWGTSWGTEGYFKIARGFNHVKIESMIVGVYPMEAYK